MKSARVVRLRVIGGHVDLRDDIPKTRADCPTQRPCPHIKCRWHLWLVTGPDRPGHRFDGQGPTETTMRSVWLEWPIPPSCGADIVERGHAEEWTAAQYAAAIGLSESGYWYRLRVARAKLLVAGGSSLAEEDEELVPAPRSIW